VAVEVALDMRPARLASGGVEMAVSVPAVRDHDPGVAGGDQGVELLAVAVLGDLQEHGARSRRGPQCTTFTARAPAGLIDMHRVLVQNPVLQVQMWAGERVRRALADRSTAPIESSTPNRSRASSLTPRREIRYPAVNVTIAACNRGPNADPASPSGNWALVRARQHRQRS
jgi:hypothetical protein